MALHKLNPEFYKLYRDLQTVRFKAPNRPKAPKADKPIPSDPLNVREIADPIIPPTGTVLSQSDITRLLKSGRVKVAELLDLFPRQKQAITRLERIIFMGGSKFGGKTVTGRRWLISGNPDKPNFDSSGTPNLINMSYVYHPSFLGVVIRKNEKDLHDWIQKAEPEYKILGATLKRSPTTVFEWPSKATVLLGHAADSDAWTKYSGQNIVRFLIEEAGQIPNRETLDHLLSCCRSVYPEMRAQMFLTANPGGAGHQWLYDYFIEPKDREGNILINPSTKLPYHSICDINGFPLGCETIEESVEIPEQFREWFDGKTESKVTRCWVPSYMTDNPSARNDPEYILALSSMRDDKQRRGLLLGDWKAFQGIYFDMFSKSRHTYDPGELPIAPWWESFGAVDIGYAHDAACGKAKKNPLTGQWMVYEEFGGPGIDYIELGAEIAKRSLKELQIQGTMTYFISHDAYHRRTGDFTAADLLRRGIGRIIGETSVYIPDLIIDRMNKESLRPISEQVRSQILNMKTKGIVLKRAPKDRALGFSYIRALMRLEPLIRNTPAPEWETARHILEVEGSTGYITYLKSFNVPVEVLPELLISRDCKRIIDAIPKAVHSEKNPEDIDSTHFQGMDWLDMLRYLCGGVRDLPSSTMPLDILREQRMQALLSKDRNFSTQDLSFFHDAVSDQWNEDNPEPESFHLTRCGRMTRLLAAGDLTD